jgi:chromosomal replication initiation ATPase DnaA
LSPRQIPLPLLEPRVATGRADFLVAPCNAEAVALIDRWPGWPDRTLLITGPAGSGKSHLGEVWRAVSGALHAMAGTLTAEAVPPLLATGALVLDRADEARDEAALFHLLNFARAGELSLLLLARTPAETWPVSRADLRSRLKAVTGVAVQPPDETLLQALLVKLLSDRQIAPVPPEVLAFLVSRLERSYAAAEQAVEAIDRESLGRRRGVTLAVAKAALAGFSDPPEGAP